MKKSNTKIFLQKLTACDQKYDFYREHEKTLVGFSGGADSTALLHALTVTLGHERVVAVHVNHLLRGEAANGDERFCEELCQRLGVPFFSERVDVRALCGGGSFEAAARELRYQIFEKLAKREDCATVSLAHTASDNLETMIFHLCRGAGAAGLSGIPPKRTLGEKAVVRPLIDITREEVLAYLAENGLSHREDATNSDTAYTRNFIRAEIVPLFKKVNANAVENARYAAEAITDLRFLAEDAATSFLRENERDGKLCVKALATLSSAVRYPVLEEMYCRAGGGSLSRLQAEAVERLLLAGKNGASVSLTGKITARIDAGKLRFLSEGEIPDMPSGEISLILGENRIGEHILIYIAEKPSADIFASFSAEADIPSASLSSLHIRARREGDAYRFGGMTRKLKKLLCGAELSAKKRPVLCDGDGILWFPSFPVSDEKRIGTDTIHIYYFEK